MEYMNSGTSFNIIDRMVKYASRGIVFGALLGMLLCVGWTTTQAADAVAQPASTGNSIYITRYLPDILQEAQGPADMVFLIYRYLMGLVGIVAVGVIMYGGVLRTMSADPSKIRASNEYIKSALKGIVLLFGAQVLFNTINPNIIDIERIQRIIQPSERLVPGVVTQTDIALVGDEDVEQRIIDSDTKKVIDTTDTRVRLSAIDGVKLPSECVPGGSTKGCISLQGVRQDTVNAMASMAKAGIPVTVTSVTEGVHQQGVFSHANGYKWDMAAIPESDFASKPDRFEKMATRSDSKATYRDKVTGAECSLESSPPHWDCAVKPVIVER